VGPTALAEIRGWFAEMATEQNAEPYIGPRMVPITKMVDQVSLIFATLYTIGEAASAL
jgi:hypothetical protein